MVVMRRMTDYQGVSLTEAYDNRSVMAQIARIKDRLTAVEQNVDPTLREDLETAITELEALETTVSGIGTQVETNTGDISGLETEVAAKADSSTVAAALELKADKAQLTDGSVTMVGTANVGSDVRPIKLVAGVPAEVSGDLMPRSGGTFTGNVTCNNPVSVKDNLTLTKCIVMANTTKTSINASSAAKWVAVDGLRTDDYCTPMIRLAFSVSDAAVVYVEIIGNEKTIVRKGGSSEIDVAVKPYKVGTTSRDISVYFRIPAGTGSNVKAYLMSEVIVDTAGMSKPVFSSSLYDDVSYDSKTIPNIANYEQFTWTILSPDTWAVIPKGTVNGP